MVIWTNEIPAILQVSVKAGKMIQEKRQLPLSIAQN